MCGQGWTEVVDILASVRDFTLGLLAEKVPTASVLARLVLVTCKPFLSGPCLLVGYQGMVTCDMEPQLLNSVRCDVCCYTVAAEQPSVNKSQLGGKCAAVLTWNVALLTLTVLQAQVGLCRLCGEQCTQGTAIFRGVASCICISR